MPLPYGTKGMDVTLAGILTAVEAYTQDKRYRSWDQLDSIKEGDDVITPQDLCFSLQETTFAMLVEITERAMAHVGSADVLIVGGVGSNLRLQQMMGVMAAERGGQIYGVESLYAVDNGVMVAQAGILAYRMGQTTPLSKTSVTQR